MAEDKIVCKYILHAVLLSKSPFLVASGAGETADAEVIKKPDGNPYVPGSSLAGVLKRLSSKKDDSFIYLWGTDKKDISPHGKHSPIQSHIIVDNLELLTGHKHSISIRDGVKINYSTGTAEAGSKYDYEITEPGHPFFFRLEVTVRQSFTQFTSNIEEHLKIIASHLKHGIRLGALTNTGFGLFKCERDLQCRKFDFSNETHQFAWFDYIVGQEISENTGKEVFRFDNLHSTILKDSFVLTSTFQLKSSLLTATYGIDAQQPDKSQLKSNGEFVLSGKSIRGAIRHRAHKILNTIEHPEADNLIKNLFGWVDESKDNQGRAIRGKLIIDETILTDAVIAQEQPRIKINRFIGSAADNALFSSEAVWRNGNGDFQVRFEIKNYNDEEAGLLLLILKDLWTGDLAIGGEKNIGRGTLHGINAEIKYGEHEIKWSMNNKLSTQDAELLEKFVQTLNQVMI